MASRPATPVLIGPFPGPLHGVSVINALLASRMMARAMPVRRINLAPGNVERGLAYHATRMIRVLAGVARILLIGLSGRNRRYVMSVDGGAGIYYNIALALAVRMTGQALLLYHHSTRYVFSESSPMRWLLRIAGPRTPQVFCSLRMARQFQDRYGELEAVLIVSNAAWVDPGSAGAGSMSGLRLGFLGALTEEKGLARAFATLRVCRAHGLPTTLALAGPAPDAGTRALLEAAQAEFGDALVINGVLRGPERTSFYGALDILLFPSLYSHETQSLVVPEALATGTPVIAYDHRYVGEILGDGGVLVPLGADFALTAAAFIAGGTNPDVRNARRRSAFAWFEKQRAAADGQVEQLMNRAGESTP